MGHIDKERFFPVFPDEANCPFSVIGRHSVLVQIVTDNLIAFISRKVREIENRALLRMEGPHII